MIARVGRIDHLVVAAGAGVASGPFADGGPDALMAAVNGKLMAQARVVHAAMGAIVPGGSITFIGGVAGRKALPGMAPAAVANLGLEALARVLAREIAPVRVNVVAPGLVDTPAYARMPEAARRAMFAGAAASLPAGRIGAPTDIGDAILAIATNPSLTGEVVVIEAAAPACNGSQISFVMRIAILGGGNIGGNLGKHWNPMPTHAASLAGRIRVARRRAPGRVVCMLMRSPRRGRGVGVPHGVQDHRQLARQGDLGLQQPGALGDHEGPVAEAGCAELARYDGVGGLVEMNTGHTVDALRDAAGAADLAGLVAPRR